MDNISIGQLYPTVGTVVPTRRLNPSPTNNQDKSFHDVFQDKMIRFSHHAEQRLQQRGIQLQPEQIAKIQTAIDKAASKGAKDSLILMKDMALIVNVKNRTVVTAMDGASMKDSVFTQIDSAVVIS
jgi:flagellar operon protein